MHSLKVIKCIKNTIYGQNDLTWTLLDLIVLDNIFKQNLRSDIKVCYFKENKVIKVDPIFQPFKRVDKLSFYKNDVQEESSMLQLPSIFQADIIDLDTLDQEELNYATNPEFYKYEIQELSYWNYCWGLLGDLALENISKIKPKMLVLSWTYLISDIIRVLSSLPENMIICFDKNYQDSYTLKFSNVTLLIKDNDDIIRLKCKEVWFKSNGSLNQNDIQFLHSNFIWISNCINIKIAHFKKESFTYIISEIVPSSDLINDSWYLASFNNLVEMRLNWDELKCLLLNDDNRHLLPTFFSSSKVIISLKSMEDVFNFDEMNQYVPNHWELEIRNIYSKN